MTAADRADCPTCGCDHGGPIPAGMIRRLGEPAACAALAAGRVRYERLIAKHARRQARRRRIADLLAKFTRRGPR